MATIQINTDAKPFDDVRVRQALRYAVDRKAMMEAATGGLGSLGNDTPVSPSNPYYNKALPQRRKDVAKAKKLLAEAGYPNGIDITLYTSTQRPGLEPAAVVAQQTLAESGFRVKIESVEIARLYKDIIPKPKTMATSHNNWFGRPTIDESLTPFYYTKSNWNYTGYSNPEVDKLFDQAAKVTDVEKRKKLFFRIQEIMHEELPHLQLVAMPTVTMFNKRVQNMPTNGISPYTGYADVWVK